MFRYLFRKIRYIGMKQTAQSGEKPKQKEEASPPQDSEQQLSEVLDCNLQTFKNVLGDSADIKTHRFTFGSDGKFSGALVWVDGLADSKLITESILKPLLHFSKEEEAPKSTALLPWVQERVLCNADIVEKEQCDELIQACLSGDTVLMLDGATKGLVISTKGWDKRGVIEPSTESVVRGPREGFTENFRTNTSLIRRKIKHPDLRMEHMTLGEKTRTDVAIVYIDGVANPKVIKSMRKRLGNICTDSILETGYIEEFIEDSPFSPFPTMDYSEKPDVVAAKLLEGRVGVVVDGTPFVLTAPMLFMESFQSAEDYYGRTVYFSLIRMMRIAAFLLTVFAPGLYIAFTTFHQEMIPTTLLFTIAAAREGTPFSATLEALIMIFAFEILREAGLRLPRPVGQAISIVGALIMGDAAVSAGLVGAPMVIVIAVTAVASFINPVLDDAASILRIFMVLIAGTYGGFGIVIGSLAILIHLASLKSFGMPYFAGVAPAIKEYQKDMFIRAPLPSMVKRPLGIAFGDIFRRRQEDENEDEEDVDEEPTASEAVEETK